MKDMKDMKWHMEQNEEGTKCIITCAKGVDFREINLRYRDRFVESSNAKWVHLLMPPLSWVKRKSRR